MRREVWWRRAGIVATVAIQVLVGVASIGAIWGGILANSTALSVVMCGFGAAGIVSIGFTCRDVEEQLSRLDSVNQLRRRLQQ